MGMFRSLALTAELGQLHWCRGRASRGQSAATVGRSQHAMSPRPLLQRDKTRQPAAGSVWGYWFEVEQAHTLKHTHVCVGGSVCGRERVCVFLCGCVLSLVKQKYVLIDTLCDYPEALLSHYSADRELTKTAALSLGETKFAQIPCVTSEKPLCCSAGRGLTKKAVISLKSVMSREYRCNTLSASREGEREREGEEELLVRQCVWEGGGREGESHFLSLLHTHCHLNS